MAAPVLGVLAGVAARAAVGVAGRAVAGLGARAAGSGFARLAGGAARMAGRAGRAGRRTKIHLRRKQMSRGARKLRWSMRKAGSFARKFGIGGAPPRSQSSASGFYSQPQQQPAGVGFASVGGTQTDPQQAQQIISQFANRLAAASTVLSMFTAGVGVAVTAVKALHGFASVLVDSQRGTARFSGTMSAATAGLEVGRVGRELSQAQATGPSFSKLTHSLDKLERAMQPFRESFTNALNEAVSGMIDVVTPLVTAARPLAKQMEQLVEWGKKAFALIINKGDANAAANWQAIMDAIERRNERQRQKRIGQNFGDLLNLRANMGAIKGMNKPNPNIPNQPAKGGKGGQNNQPPPAAPVFAPQFPKAGGGGP